MPHLLIRHKVADFAKWKAAYDDHLGARQAAWVEEVHLLRSLDDPNDVLLLFSTADVEQAKSFAA